MFQSIHIFNKDGRRLKRHFCILDSDFTALRMMDASALFVEAIIEEYTSRNLNVIQNLKLYLDWERKSFRTTTLKQALDKLNNIRCIINNDNEVILNFDQYYYCLYNYLQRSRFVGKLK